MPAETALVIDDNCLNLELTSFLLEAGGFAVSTAATAEAAIQSLEHSVPTLLVVDVQLPGISGLELISKLRSNSRYATVCVVVVTSYATNSDRGAAYGSGCDGYVSKPIDTRSFVAQMRIHIAERRRLFRCDEKPRHLAQGGQSA